MREIRKIAASTLGISLTILRNYIFTIKINNMYIVFIFFRHITFDQRQFMLIQSENREIKIFFFVRKNERNEMSWLPLQSAAFVVDIKARLTPQFFTSL